MVPGIPHGSGFFDEENVKPTLREIARQARVHYSTASYILNGANGSTRVSEATRQRVLTIADQLGYRANRAAQQLRTRRSQVIGLLVGDLENPFFARLVSLCTLELERAGYESVLAMRRPNEVSDLHLLETLLSRQVDGVLIWSESATELREWIATTPQAPKAVILGYRMDQCDSVEAELEAGIVLALQHLLEQGFQRIAYLAPADSLTSTGDPRPGTYRRVMQAAGRPDRIYSFALDSHSAGAARLCAEQIACERPSERPDALLCFNDMTAIGALMGLRRKGLRVPQDVALVGCDDLPLAAQMDVPLTSIVYPLEAMCRSAIEMLLDRLSGSFPASAPEANAASRSIRYRSVPTTLAIRQSSRRDSADSAAFNIPTFDPLRIEK
ncbi:MAG: LacI family DNA-binding transcriptional regulator [Armatimonadaceae bacterium]